MKYNEFMNVYINTKISGDIVNCEIEPLIALKLAESKKTLKIWDNNTFYCCFKTRYNGSDAVLILFSIEFIGPSSGSSSASEKIMSIVDHVSKELQIIDYMKYYKFQLKEEKRKNIVILKIIKIIREDDIL